MSKLCPGHFEFLQPPMGDIYNVHVPHSVLGSVYTMMVSKDARYNSFGYKHELGVLTRKWDNAQKQ